MRYEKYNPQPNLTHPSHAWFLRFAEFIFVPNWGIIKTNCMRISNALKLSMIFSMAILSTFIVSCSDDENEPEPPPSVSIGSFTPDSGPTGISVTIAGENFSTTLSENKVEFNGVSATITSATKTSLVVTVPASATTGKVKVTTNGKSATSINDFTIPEPSITAVSHTIAAPGVSVTISGENFSPVAENNIVKFNGVTGVVTDVSEGALTVTVPEGATPGTISVTVGGNSATSTSELEICTGMAELVISDVVVSNTSGATSYTVKFTITNVGAADADVSKMTMQNYVSEDDAYGAGDLAASGYTLVSAPVLAPGESFTTDNYGCGISAGGNTTSHPYLAITLFGSIDECNDDNNVVIVPFQQD